MHMQETELMKSCHNFIHLTSNTKKIDLNQIYLTQNSIILCLHNKCLYSITIFYGIWRVYDDTLQQSYKTWLHLTNRHKASLEMKLWEIKQIKTIELQYRCQQNYKLYNYWNSVIDFRRYKIQASKVTLFAFYSKHA